MADVPHLQNTTVEDALREAEGRFSAANPKSLDRHRRAQAHLPGGNTRTNMYFSPFPLTIVRGEAARLYDADGHAYVDFLGEYTAGIFGHSHPQIRAAIIEAVDAGLNLGGPNRWEAELGRVMCERFPSLDKVRFCNSGTEANLYAISTARAATGRTHIMVFDGAYHGGVLSFVKPSPMTVPFPFILAQYNDIEGTAGLIAHHGEELAAILIEPMIGSGGGIAADREFLLMLREETRLHGIVLIFDEVMTSRLSSGGLQAKLGIIPDMTSFGKYLGGGLTFGAFGGRDTIMRRFDPSEPDSFVHSGTYNNNTPTMAAGVAALREIYTPEAAETLNARGDRLRERINAVFRRHGVSMQMLGQGSLNVIHVHGRPMRRPADVVNDPKLQALFHLEMLDRGIYLSRRGLTALCLPLAEADLDRFVEAADEFCSVYRPLLRDPRIYHFMHERLPRAPGRPTSQDRLMASIDPVTVSVVQHRLHSIVEEMGEAMLRTSYSQILNSSRDFSTALSDPEGRLIAQAEHVPIHVGALPWAVTSVHEFFRGRIHPGDVFLLNDPYRGGNHLPDLTAFVPVFDGDRLAFWSINRSHQSDIGGATHGGYNPAATEIWHEGLRVPPLRLYDRGRLIDDVNELLVLNVRHPRDFRGDLAAMIGSARVGERRLQALLAEFGSAETHAAIEAVLDGAERQVRAVIRQWPDGVYYGEAMIDDDGHRFKDIHIRAKVTKRDSDLEVDLTDCHEEVDGFINSAYPNTRSAVVVALSYLIDPETPKNDGAFRPVTVITREGTIVHPRPGKPVTLSTNCCGQEVIEAVIKALAPACPDRAMAGWGRRFRIAIQGVDPRTRKSFIWHLFQARPGGGASLAGDGWPGAGEWQAAGGIKFGSIEVAEVRFPLFFRRHQFRSDSGGDGRFRGGPGGDLEFAVEVAEPAVGNTAGDGVKYGACGILGGQDGAPHRYVLRSAGGEERVLKTKEAGITIRPGDVIAAKSGGGGGWGDPAGRSAEERARDVALGFVDAEGEH